MRSANLPIPLTPIQNSSAKKTRRNSYPQDVANAALFLACDESGYTYDLTLTTDPGITAGSSTKPVRYAEHQPLIR